MSFEAIKWALGQPVVKSPAKFVLVAMASCVNGDGAEMLCWPSIKHLTDATRQDRKTVMDGLRRLREDGFIKDTGERRGITAQVPVYLLKSPESGTVKESKEVAGRPVDNQPNSTENGTGTESGTVPKTDANSPVFPHEQSRISLSTVPKTGHGIKKEPVRNQEGTSKRGGGFDAARIDLPEWMDAEAWQRWAKDRRSRGKAITEDAARLQLKTLRKFMDDGYAPAAVIDTAIENGWQGLYEPKGKPKAAGKHAGFSGKNYREGVGEDGSFN